MRRRQRRSDWPFHFALGVFGDAWSLLIVRDLMFKNRRTYTELLRAEEGIATNILADRLVRLEEDGIIARDEKPGGGVSYRLTPKGIDLAPVMVEHIGWSAKYDARTDAEQGVGGPLRADRGRLLADLRTDLEARAKVERT